MSKFNYNHIKPVDKNSNDTISLLDIKNSLNTILGLKDFSINKSNSGIYVLNWNKDPEVVFAHSEPEIYTHEDINLAHFEHNSFFKEEYFYLYKDRSRTEEIKIVEKILSDIKNEWGKYKELVTLQDYFILFHCVTQLQSADISENSSSIKLLNLGYTKRSVHNHLKNLNFPKNVTKKDIKMYLDLPRDFLETLLS